MDMSISNKLCLYLTLPNDIGRGHDQQERKVMSSLAHALKMSTH